jgi:hypothetical protein
VSAWRLAQEIRASLIAAADAMHEPDRSDVLAWSGWANAHADAIDPMRHPPRNAVARRTETG